MIKLDLGLAAEEFETISDETDLFYNKETGEFVYYSEYMDSEDIDAEEFEDDVWIAAPNQRDLGEYDIMVDFTDSVKDLQKHELLSVALEGRGAFRRFKDTLNRVDLENEWYAFKHKAFVKIAKEWCDDNCIEYTDDTGYNETEMDQYPEGSHSASPDEKSVKGLAVTLVTLESHNHIVGDIERGVKVFSGGGVEVAEHEPNMYWVRVPHKHGSKIATIVFTKDGRDIKTHSCQCTMNYRDPPVCRHVVAAVLAIQGGIVESGLALGKTATARAVVGENNTARAVGSGSLDVFATPMMIALIEQAACECLADVMNPGQTSVGTEINVSHTAASPIGAEITATARIEAVFGRKIEFIVTTTDNVGEIGKGKHTRVIVDAEKFMNKVGER